MAFPLIIPKYHLVELDNPYLRCTILDEESDNLTPICCAVCDAIPLEPQWYNQIDTNRFAAMCKASNMHKPSYPESLTIPGEGEYQQTLLEQYTAPDERLSDFLLSPKTIVRPRDDTVVVCKACSEHMQVNLEKVSSRHNHPPKTSIANGYLIGDAPNVLMELTDVELSLVSLVRIYCQSWICFAGCHQHIKGWHTFFKNRPSANVGNLQQLELRASPPVGLIAFL